ncbi:hypothetical protein [Rugosimonospora acidiphila]|uniref:hypothetical protein n=1 Tax=Rugosimonospora acidiphila TaxID=556531 RepID=UPI0031F11D44
MTKTKSALRAVGVQATITTAGADTTAPKSTVTLLHPVQPTGGDTGGITKKVTGLATGEFAKAYAEQVSSIEAKWDALSPKERVAALLAPANAALTALGVPPLNPQLSFLGGDPTSASFFSSAWMMQYGNQFPVPGLSHDKFSRAAGTIYHEARHAEQTFRVARKLAGDGKNEADIKAMLEVDQTIAQAALKAPLTEAQQDEWAQAAAWQLNLEKKAGLALADTVNTSMFAAMDKYQQSQTAWQNYQKAASNDPATPPEVKQWYDTIAAADEGPDYVAEFKAVLQQNYLQDREMFKQWYRFYANMPVEQDAWSVGGQVEQLLCGKAYTPEDVLADLGPDDRTMTAIAQSQSDMLYQSLLAALSEYARQNDLPQQ